MKQNTKRTIIFSCLGLLLASFFLTGCTQGLMTPNGAGVKAQDYLNQHFLNGKKGMKGLVAKFTKAEEKGDFYAVELQIIKEDKDEVQHTYNVYVTKSGNNIILNPDAMYIYDMSQSPDAAMKAAQKAQEDKAIKSIPKTEKPDIKLFVMSGCPYGVQAEDAALPVVKHMGKDLNLNMHFIVNKGKGKNCFGNYCAMHGRNEAKENARQACIAQQQNDKFWAYIEAFNKDCSVSSRVSESDLDKCAVKAAKTASVNYNKVLGCMKNSNALLEKETKLIQEHKAFGSPTLIINGQKYSGPRTPQAFQKAFCASFKNAPESCNTIISGEYKTNKPVSGGCKAN